MRRLLALSLLALSPPLMSFSAPLPKPSAAKLPLWRGFNLLEKFHLDWNNKPFVEDDFHWISELGFNFVRLPMDYRTWILGGDWRKFNEATLKEVDQAVEWGKKYNVHVCLNFHRGPGYTVADPKEPKNLWTDKEAQEVFCLHWAKFARRYKGIPNENLSFDLLNEPADVTSGTYARIVRMAVEAIHHEDPSRLVIADANNYGSSPVHEFASAGVAQMTRGYAPFQLTHYGASWVGDNKDWPVPVWPVVEGVGAHLYGTAKPEWKEPLVLKLEIKGAGTSLIVRVQKVSSKAILAVRADGKEILRRVLEPKLGAGEWKKSEYVKEWNIVQASYELDVGVELPAGTRELRIENVDGDWMTLSRVEIKPFPGAPGGSLVLNPAENWGTPPGSFTVQSDGRLIAADGSYADGRTKLWKDSILPFKTLEAKGVGIHVGEWGAFNQTPHGVTLAWMEDCLKNWKEAGWGWALWNFRGSFGVLDSERADVKYEDFRGHKLDRKMLDVLQKY